MSEHRFHWIWGLLLFALITIAAYAFQPNYTPRIYTAPFTIQLTDPPPPEIRRPLLPFHFDDDIDVRTAPNTK